MNTESAVTFYLLNPELFYLLPRLIYAVLIIIFTVRFLHGQIKKNSKKVN